MQRVCFVASGVKEYLQEGLPLPEAEDLQCPFCSKAPHRLRLHGHYTRQVLFPDPEGCHRVEVRRLLCARTGKTVSLLPDFCLPRRQHGPAILGLFLTAIVFEGRGLLAALSAVRRETPGHAVAQALWQGFLARLPKLRTYLATLRPRLPLTPARAVARHRDVALVMVGLCEGFADPAMAFRYHGRLFHRLLHEGMA